MLGRFRGNQNWTLVSNEVKSGGNFVVLDLGPATWYNLRVTAHNRAGSTAAEYEFATLTTTGSAYCVVGRVWLVVVTTQLGVPTNHVYSLSGGGGS